MQEIKLELVEISAFSGTNSWQLKGNHLIFRGTKGDGTQLPPVKPISVSKERLAKFVVAFDFLDVWKWKANYDPIECGYGVTDGMSWSLKISIGDRNCISSGSNAFPSFADPQKASLDSERYGFLVFAFQSAFGIHMPKRNFLDA